MSNAKRRALVGLAACGLMANFEALAQVELGAPSETGVGAVVEVSHSGQTDPLDFISIDAKGAAEAEYGQYGYVKSGNPIKLRAPDVPGDYQIRYHEAKGPYAVKASRPLTVVDVEAKIDLPAEIVAGAGVQVTFSGPNTKGDFISIDRADAGDRDYGPYVYANKGSPAAMRAPDEPGAYVARYHLGQTYRVIASAPVTVRGVAATIDAPASATAGSELAIAWTGPDDPQDFISIDTPGAGDRDYGTYAYTAAGSVVTIRAPEDPGDYAIRYHTGQTYRVLAERQLRVDPATASLDGPGEVEARAAFEVAWSGPNNPEDYIALSAPDAEANRQTSFSYTKRGTPARLEAPVEPGTYELRYVTGLKHHVLARAALNVTAGATPGTLRITAAADTEAAYGAVELILDASGSMLQRLGGARRIDLAKASLVHLTSQVIPEGSPFALRVFGHREANACRTDLEISLAPLDRAAAVAKINTIEAKNLARTPIGESLRLVESDLAGVEGSAVVVLVTDGEETCDGNPVAAIEKLRKVGFDVRVNIVGFGIEELALKEEFESWATIGRGAYFDAADGEALATAMRASLRLPYQVEKDGQVVATGVVNGDPIELAPGTYAVEVLATPSRRLSDVNITAGEESVLPIP